MSFSFPRILVRVVLPLLAAVGATGSSAQTIGLLTNEPGSFEGYTLFETLVYPEMYLIDHQGERVHTWTFDELITSTAYLLENGDLIRAGKAEVLPQLPGDVGGLIQRFDWDGNLLWQFQYADSIVLQHHDLWPLPNGNVLILAKEIKTFAECVQAGRDPAQLLNGYLRPEHVVEVEPVGTTGGNIVWEWHAWDHLIQDFDPTKDNYGVVADHPELVDINYMQNASNDWLHANALAYNADLDQIMISLRANNELWIVDHGTTTAEAAGHTGGTRGQGGDLLYRWGNPLAYDRGILEDRTLYKQHDPHWIPDGLTGAGRVLVFNNGNDRPEGQYSTVDEIVTTVDANGDYPTPLPGEPHGPDSVAYSYVADPPESLYSPFISGAQRLPNDNTLICQGNVGRIFELDPAEDVVWEYIVPVNADGPMVQGSIIMGTENRTFRAKRFAPDYPAFDGRDLTPFGPIELPKGTSVPTLALAGSSLTLHPNRPNPFRETTSFTFSLDRASQVSVEVFDVAGRRVATVLEKVMEAGRHELDWSAHGLTAGVYYVRANTEDASAARKVLVVK